MLTKRDVDDVLVQGDYQSGDRYTVASALRLDPKLGVLILAHRNEQKAAKELKGMYDKAAGAQRVEIAWLGRTTDSADQIKRVPKSSYSQVKATIDELIEALKAKRVDKVWRDNWRKRWPKFLTDGIEAGINLQIATYGTKVVAGKFGADPGGSQSSLRQYFKGPQNKEAGLRQWLERRGFEFGRSKTKYVLLWAKRGDQKAEKAHHFTSYVALSRIAHEIRSQTAYKPVAAGDRLLLDTRPSLAQFWDDRSWKELFPTAGRTEQQHVYEYLARNCDILSIGTRSGALELPALLGIRTLYLEEVANEQAERMERWIGKVPGFSRLIVDAPPGLSGDTVGRSMQGWVMRDGVRSGQKTLRVRSVGQKTYWTSQDRKSAAAADYAESIRQRIHRATGGLRPKYAYDDVKREKPDRRAAKAIAEEASVRATTVGLNDDEMKALIDWVNDPNSRNIRRRAKNLKTEKAIGGSYNFYETIGEGTGKGKSSPRGKYSENYSKRAYLDELQEKAAAAVDEDKRKKEVATTTGERFGKKWAGYYQLHDERDEFRLMNKQKQPISDKFIPLKEAENWKLWGEDEPYVKRKGWEEVLYVNRNGFYILME